MENPFLQRPFPVSPSMNQVHIIDLPGLAVPDGVRGKTAFQLLSRFALHRRVTATAKLLQIDHNDPHLLRKFDDCLTAVSPQVRTSAEIIAQDYGRSLAYLLLTLKRGDAINQQARPDWQQVHWAFWQQIETVWLGGGLLSGNLGQTAVPLARDLIRQNGFPNFQLQLAPNGRQLPLLGMGCMAAPGTKQMLLFDFGQTAVKRAIAHYQDLQFTQLELLPNLPVPCENVLQPSLELAEIAHFADWLLDVLATTWQETAVAYPDLSLTVAVSLACYLLDGQPRPEDVGCYGRMQYLTAHLNQFLTEGLARRLGQPASVKLWHDGTAAALTQAGMAQTAVLTFGTAIGIGFPPENDAPYVLSSSLIIQPTV